jgi:hypothetical protein
VVCCCVSVCLAHQALVEVNRKARTIHISRLFQWYGSDFGGTPERILQFISRYSSAVNSLIEEAQSSSDDDREQATRLVAKTYKLKHKTYDWTSIMELPRTASDLSRASSVEESF